MDCRQFRNKHVAFVDDLLSSFEMNAMRQHLSVCSRCSRQDTSIRRSLMIVHNLPAIEPSPEFIQRLNARLAELGPESRVDIVARPQVSSVASFAALAAGIAAVAYLAIETNNYFGSPNDLRFGSVVAVAPEPPTPAPLPITNAALVASVPTGIPVWPAVLMVGQTPMHFASMDARDTEQAR